MKSQTVNGWTIFSSDFHFFVLENAERVAVKIDDSDNSELFYGTITEDAVRIFELNTYQADIDINLTNKSI